MVTSLSKMSTEDREKYMKYYEDVLLSGVIGFTVLKPNPDFDDNGLRFPVDYLNEIGINIIFMPIEIMSEYVDSVTKTHIDKNDDGFIYHQFIDSNFDGSNEDDFNTVNATALGNLAYAALNCKNEKARQIAEKNLNHIFVKAKGKMLNSINEEI